jgi:hypothetical protein
MSISVVAVDKLKPKHVININCILIDESIQTIKEKLFIGNTKRADGVPYIPNFVKIEIKTTNGLFVPVTKSLFKTISDEFTHLPQKNTIYVTNLFDVLDDFTEIYNQDTYESRFEELKQEYSDLTEDDLRFVVKDKLHKSFSEHENFPNKDELVEFLGEYSDSIVDLQDTVYNKYNEENGENNYIKKFYDQALETTYPPDEIDNVKYTDITLKITGSNVTKDGTLFINIEKMFNILELSEDIPFIALSRKYTGEKGREPMIKTHNSLLETVSAKEVKSWVLNEKKKLNQATFKIIKGILIKVRLFIKNESVYLTVNILPNGLIEVDIKLGQGKNNDLDLDQIIDLIKSNVDRLIEQLNQLDVFAQSKHISRVNNSEIVVKGINNIITTNFFINRDKFKDKLKNKEIHDHLLQLKPTESPSVLSVYYKNIYKYENFDVKGLTINIKDNPYDLNSSIINIFGAENFIQSQVIFTIIYILSKIDTVTKTNGFVIKKKERKVKEKTNKSMLKEEGYYFNSKKCQPPRQPSIEAPNTPLNENTIKFNKWIIKCKNKSHQFPGFLKDDNIPCCFKNNQVGNEAYIRNTDPDSLNILIRPSNFKITVKHNKKKVETFVVQLVSDEGNYYYISEDNKPVLITDEKQKAKIVEAERKAEDEEGDLWLETVTLSQLIYPPPTNKCSTQPILNKRLSSQGFNTLINLEDGVNTPCEHHKKSKFFGYGSNSVPCCYDTIRPLFSTRDKKDVDISKQYITTSPNKLLNYRKIGVLSDDLSKLFNDLLSTETATAYYRMGIVQSKHSILSVILLGIDGMIGYGEGAMKVKGISNFKNIIIQYLKSNPEEFAVLNKGRLSIKFSTLENYLNYIERGVLYWNDILDIVEKIIDMNILIIDTGVNTDTEVTTKILCRPDHLYKENKPYLILLKKKYIDEINKTVSETFELVIKLEQQNDTKTNKLYRYFPVENHVIKFLLKYYSESCIKEKTYPETFPYEPLFSLETLQEKVANNKERVGELKYQIVNDFDRVNLLMTSKNLILPVYESGIIQDRQLQLQKVTLENIITTNELLTLDKYIKFYKYLDISVIGVGRTKNKDVGGILTSFGVFVPYKVQKSDVKLETVDFNYYFDVDKKLKNDDDFYSNDYITFNKQTELTNNHLFKVKTRIATRIENSPDKVDFQEYIKRVITATNHTRMDKIDKVVDILKQLLKGYDINSHAIFLLRHIANEIVLDNIENSLLNGIVTSRNDGKDIVKRDTESVLLNLDDIYNWIRKHQII